MKIEDHLKSPLDPPKGLRGDSMIRILLCIYITLSEALSFITCFPLSYFCNKTSLVYAFDPFTYLFTLVHSMASCHEPLVEKIPRSRNQ